MWMRQVVLSVLWLPCVVNTSIPLFHSISWTHLSDVVFYFSLSSRERRHDGEKILHLPAVGRC